MKKILFCTMTMKSGGAERVIANLSNEFSKDYNVAITTLLNTEIDYDLNSKIVILPCSNNKKNGLISKIKNSIKLYNNIKEYHPEVVISFCPTMCFITCFFKFIKKQMKDIKLVISERNDPNNEYRNIITKILANWLYSKADLIVFQTSDAKKYFSKKIQEKSVIIPNPINEKFIKANIKLKKENSIVNVGRLESQKNQELLIKACAKVFEKYPDWKLKIYGTGSLKNELILLTKKLEIENKVLFLGRCNELENELPKSKIFVLSSDYEGMPNALMEAMACGLCCVSTDCPCGGSKELIKNKENGLLVPVKNVDELYKAICYLIENKMLYNYIAKNAQQIKNNYSNDIIFDKWRKII